MKKRFALLILFIGTFAYLLLFNDTFKRHINRWATFSFCDSQITYTLRNVDPRFNISQKQLLEDLETAADIWNDILDKELFVYDEESELDINLVYDERQSAVSKINETKDLVEEQTAKYQNDLAKFERDKNSIQEKLDKLNEEIQYWNNKGGAPKEIFEELTYRQAQLQREIDRINSAVETINTAAEKINTQIETVNEKVNTFNELLAIKPEEGLYMAGPEKIDIYLYDTQKSFIHTAAHELGHALGLDHVDQEDSIMYPTSSPDSHATAADIAAIKQFCAEQNRFDLIRHDLKNLVYKFLYDLNIVLP